MIDAICIVMSAHNSSPSRRNPVLPNGIHVSPQALHGLAPKCKLINMHELIHKSTNDYVTLLPCENGVNVNNKG